MKARSGPRSKIDGNVSMEQATRTTIEEKIACLADEMGRIEQAFMYEYLYNLGHRIGQK